MSLESSCSSSQGLEGSEEQCVTRCVQSLDLPDYLVATWSMHKRCEVQKYMSFTQLGAQRYV